MTIEPKWKEEKTDLQLARPGTRGDFFETEMPFSRNERGWACGQNSGVARTHLVGNWFIPQSHLGRPSRQGYLHFPNDKSLATHYGPQAEEPHLTLTKWATWITPRKRQAPRRAINSVRQDARGQSWPRWAGALEGLPSLCTSPEWTADPDRTALHRCLLSQRKPRRDMQRCL